MNFVFFEIQNKDHSLLKKLHYISIFFDLYLIFHSGQCDEC